MSNTIGGSEAKEKIWNAIEILAKRSEVKCISDINCSKILYDEINKKCHERG